MRICYCKADEQVNYKNAIAAHKKMRENGAKDVKLKMAGRKFHHNSCAPYATIYSKMFFDSYLKGSKNGKKGPFFRRMLISASKIRVRRNIRQKEKNT